MSQNSIKLQKSVVKNKNCIDKLRKVVYNKACVNSEMINLL